jgi:DNA helicase IV
MLVDNNLKSELQSKIYDIIKTLQAEKDIIIKFDRKNNILKIYSQEIKKI